MAETIKKNWLEDDNGNKISPYTLLDQVLKSDGTKFENDLANYAKKTDIPTKVSQLENDAGYNKTVIANNLTTTTAGSALDAVQGKILAEEDAVLEQKIADIDIQTAHETDLSLDTFEGGIGVEKIVGQTHKSRNIWANYDITSVSEYAHFTNKTLKEICPAIVAGKTYTLTVYGNGTKQIYLANGVTIPSGTSFTPSAADLSANVYVYGAESGTVTIGPWQIEEGTSATPYEPYGMWSAGYGYVDMGDLEWAYEDYPKNFSTTSINAFVQKAKDNNSVVYVIADGYSSDTATNVYTRVKDMSIGIDSNGKMRVYNSKCITVSDFKQAVSGLYLSYPLAPNATPSQYSLVVEECGKNLIDIEKWMYERSMSFTKNGDVYNVANTGECFKQVFEFSKEDIPITLSFKNMSVGTATNLRFDLLDKNDTLKTSLWYNNTSKKVSVVASKFRLNFSTGGSFTIEGLQLETGSIATPYSLYSGKTLVFPIGKTPLSSVNNIADEIVKEDGVWKRITRLGVVDLGTLNCSYGEYSGNMLFDIPLPVHTISGTESMLFSNEYVADRTNGWATLPDKHCRSYGAGIRIKDSSFTDAAAFKAAMQGVILIYDLATHTSEVLPNQEVLYSLESYADKTYITTADGLAKLGVNYGVSDVAATALLAENNAELALMGNKDNAKEISRIDSDFSIHTATDKSLDLVTSEGGIRWQDEAAVGNTHKSKNLLNPKLTSATTSNGVTCTPNGNGTYTLNGTATGGNAVFDFETINLTENTYSFTCIKPPTASNTYYGILLKDNKWTTFLADHERRKAIPSGSYTMHVYVISGQTLSNVVIKPMVTTIDATYDDYEPCGIRSTGEMGFFDGKWAQGLLNNQLPVITYDNKFISTFSFIPCVKGDTVVLKTSEKFHTARRVFYNSDGEIVSYGDLSNENMYRCIIPDGVTYVRFHIYNPNGITPSTAPKTSVSINDIDYALMVEEVGKNLINVDNKTLASPNNLFYGLQVLYKKNSTYTVSFDSTVSGMLEFIIRDSSDAKIVDKYYNFKVGNNTFNFTISAGGNFSTGMYMNASNGTYSNIQLEEGTTATPYTPYSGKNIPIPIPHPLCKVDIYRDIVKKINGSWCVYAQVGRIDLSKLDLNYTPSYFTIPLFFAQLPNLDGTHAAMNNGKAMCDGYNVGLHSTSSSDFPDRFISIGNNANYIYIRDTRYKSVQEFKDANVGNYIYYIVTTPTTEPLPNQAAMYEMESYTQQTHIDTADGLATLNVEYGTSDEIGLLLANDNKVNSIQEPDITVSTVDIGEGAALKSGAFYFVYE